MNALFVVLPGLLVFGSLSGLMLLRSQAQTTSLETTVSNSAPEVVDGSEKVCFGSINDGDDANGCTNQPLLTPPAGSIVLINFVAILRDQNGYQDLGSTSSKFYRYTGTETEACTADFNQCFSTNCTDLGQHTGQASTDKWVKCTYGIQYYSDDTQDGAVGDEVWRGYITVSDGTANGSNLGSEYTTEVAKVLALTFPDVGFGSLALGASTTAATNLNIEHENEGNVNVDLQVSLDDDDTDSGVDCAVGVIPVGNVEWNTDIGAAAGDQDYGHGSNTALVDENDGGAPQTINATICRRTDDTGPEGPNNPRTSGANSDQDCSIGNTNADDIAYTYWNIAIPATGVNGACSEELNFTAVEG